MVKHGDYIGPVTDQDGEKHLLIGDIHIRPDGRYERMKWLARFAADKEPDRLIQGGDFNDLGSGSSYDKGKFSGEGKRLQEDFDANWRALEVFAEEFERVKRPGYNPEKHILYGNHEDRIDRYVNDHPELHGLLSKDLLGFNEFEWETHPYLERVEFAGVTHCHHWPTGPRSSVAGKNAARPLIDIRKISAVSYHTHTSDLSREGLSDGRILRAYFAGCYHLYKDKYAKHQNDQYSRMLTLLNDVKDGNFDVEEWNIRRIIRRYGGEGADLSPELIPV